MVAFIIFLALSAVIGPFVGQNVGAKKCDRILEALRKCYTFCLYFGLFEALLLAIFAVLTVGLGSGFYLVANLGPGPRDGLMTGIQRKTNYPIAAVRAFLEITVVSIGWYLGGTVGIGTLLFAFGVGPAVALGLFIVGKAFN